MQTYQIPCGLGGIVKSSNLDDIDPRNLLVGQNITTENGVWEKRPGTSKRNAVAISGAPKVVGVYDFLKQNGTRLFVACTSNGNIYNETAGPAFTTTIKTGLGTDKKYTFETFNDEVYVCNGFDAVQTWDGIATGTSALTTPPTDWAGNNQPIAIIGHNNRLWGFGNANQPNIAYYSIINNGKNFTGTGSGTLAIGNKSKISGGKIIQGWLYIFKEDGSIFRVNDDSATPSKWYTEQIIDASNEGPVGLANQRLIVEAGGNAFFMSKTGRIYNLAQALQSGDLRTTDITENSVEKTWFYNWIKDNIDLAQLETDAHCIADAQRGMILWFCTKIGSSSPDIALVYFYNKKQWLIWDNVGFASGVKAYSSCLRRLSNVDYIYTGDGAGFVWQLGDSARNDGGNAYTGKFQIPHLSLENPRETKQWRRVALTIKKTGNYNLSMDTYVDEVEKETGKTFNLNTQDPNTRITALGKRFGAVFYNSNANETFRVGSILLDYQSLGARP